MAQQKEVLGAQISEQQLVSEQIQTEMAALKQMHETGLEREATLAAQLEKAKQ